MKYNLILLFFILLSCSQNQSYVNSKVPFTTKGFAYIYDENDYIEKIIKKKLNKDSLKISHNKLRSGALIKLINPKNNASIILKNSQKIDYPEFYKILITNRVAKQLNLDINLPLVEVIEIKKNKFFIAKKTQIFNEEKKIHSNAPVEVVKIDNISLNKKKINSSKKDKFFIIIAEFYSYNSAELLKKRINEEILNFDVNKLNIKTRKTNKITLLSGPYTAINSVKNDYIQLKNFGFEELDISINE